MSDELAVHIKIDPGAAVPTSKAVEAGLAKVEAAGERATKSVKSLADSLPKLSDAFKKEQTVLQRCSELHADLEAKNTPLAQGFGRIAEAIERERRALESIRGPGQQAIRDIQTLTSLLAKGSITAHEFNTSMASIRPPSNFQVGGGVQATRGGVDAASIAGSLPGGSIIAGAIGGGVAGAATAGIQTAVGGAGEIIHMADAYTGLNNRLKALTGSQADAAALFDKLHASANKTYSDVNITTDSFVKFARALKGVGATQDEAISFTEHLNMVIAQSGTDATGANAAMLQLSQALSSGMLRGEEFNSVIEQAPALLDPIAQHLGVTVGQLRQLAQQGKITSKVIFDSFKEAGPAIERSFGQAVPTVSQQFQRLKNDIGVAVGELAKDVDVTKLAADAIASLKDIVAASLGPVVALNDGLHELGMTLGDIGGGGFGGLQAFADGLSNSGNIVETFVNAGQHMTNQQDVINRFVAAGTGHLNEYSQAMVKQTLQTQLGSDAAAAFAKAMDEASGKTDAWRDKTNTLGKSFSSLVNGAGNELVEWLTNTKGKLDEAANAMDPWFNAHEKVITLNDRIEVAITNAGAVWDKLTKKQKEHHEKLSDLEQLYKRIHGPVEQSAKDLANLDILLNKHRITQGQYNAELERQIDLIRQRRMNELAASGGIVGQMGGADAIIKPMLDVMNLSTDFKPTIDLSKLNKARTQAWLDELEQYREAAKQQADALQKIFVPLGESMIDMLYDGTKGWEDWGRAALREIEKAIAKMMILKLISSITGSTGGDGGSSDGIASAIGSLIGGGGGSTTSARMLPPPSDSGFSTPQSSAAGSTPVARTAGPGGLQVVFQNHPGEVVRAFNGRAGDRYYVNTSRKWNRV